MGRFVTTGAPKQAILQRLAWFCRAGQGRGARLCQSDVRHSNRSRPRGRRAADQTLTQCSRSAAVRPCVAGREIREFTRWRDRHHPHLHLREINAAFCRTGCPTAGTSRGRTQKPRTFNRRIAAISSLYRWASEASRSPVTEPRNPSLHDPCRKHKTTRGISEEAVATPLAVIRQAFPTDRNSRRDYALIKELPAAGSLRSRLSVGKTSRHSMTEAGISRRARHR